MMDNNILHSKIKKSSQFREIENPILRYRDRQNHNLENLSLGKGEESHNRRIFHSPRNGNLYSERVSETIRRMFTTNKWLFGA